jgi:hypothetical protein
MIKDGNDAEANLVFFCSLSKPEIVAGVLNNG